jgi:hypothetical protein
MTFYHHFEKWLTIFPELANPAFGFALGHQVQDKIIRVGVKIDQKIKWCVGELKRACRSNVSPKRDFPVREEIKEKLIIFLIRRQEGQGLYFFTVVFKLADKIFNVVVLLPILDRKDEADRTCLLVRLVVAQRLVVLQV